MRWDKCQRRLWCGTVQPSGCWGWFSAASQLMERANSGDLPALPWSCSAFQPCFTGQPRQDQLKQAVALGFTLVGFVRFASCSVIRHVDVCCAVWPSVFTAVFYEFSQGFIDGPFLFVIWASTWFSNMMVWVTFCGNGDVNLLEAQSQYFFCFLCCWSATKTNKQKNN